MMLHQIYHKVQWKRIVKMTIKIMFHLNRIKNKGFWHFLHGEEALQEVAWCCYSLQKRPQIYIYICIKCWGANIFTPHMVKQMKSVSRGVRIAIRVPGSSYVLCKFTEDVNELLVSGRLNGVWCEGRKDSLRTLSRDDVWLADCAYDGVMVEAQWWRWCRWSMKVSVSLWSRLIHANILNVKQFT